MKAGLAAPVLPIVGCAVLALALFGRTLHGGFLSDDLLFGVLGTPADPGPGFDVDWAAAFADFGRPWLGFDAPLYRPLLTLSFAVDQAIGGGAPLPFHVTNIAIHVAVTALAAALGALACPTRRTLAAWVAGLAVAVHPVAAEPVAWIAARNSGLEVLFRTAAMLAYAVHLRGAGRHGLSVALACSAAALATKESGVLTPVSLVALDLLIRPRDLHAVRGRRLLPFGVLLAAYFAVRLAALGTLVGDGGGPTPPGTGLGRAAEKLFAVLAGGPEGLVTIPLLGCLLGLCVARARGLLLLGGVWLALHTVPTWNLAITAGLGGSRMVYGALPVFGILLARALVEAAGALRIAPVLAIASVGAFAVPTWQMLDRYDAAWGDMQAAREGLASAARNADAEHPLVLTAMPVNAPGIPPCNPNAWFALAERPAQSADLPTVSAGYVTVAVPGAESLLGDASAVRAMLRNGSSLAGWEPANAGFRETAPLPQLPPTLPLTDDGDGKFRLGDTLRADAVERLLVTFDGPAPSMTTCRLMTPVPDLPDAVGMLAVRGATIGTDGRAVVEIDLTHAIGPLSLATFGLPIDGFEIGSDSGARIVSLEADTRLPALDAPAIAESGTGWEALAGMVAPVDAREGATLRLMLQGPHAAMPVPCNPGDPVVVPESTRAEFDAFARISRSPRIWCWFESLGDGAGGAARSEVRSFALR
ncbi:MAG: hypothetical protein O3C51_03775 [Planctomycetota bacterium]|nr:hypothetical protein [Planctomycetota bacterium]